MSTQSKQSSLPVKAPDDVGKAITRRTAMRTGLAATAVAVAGRWVSAEPALAAARPFIPYSRGSFFRSSVRGAPIDKVATAAFRRFVKHHPEQRGTAYPVINGLGSNAWGTAYAEGRATDPVWKLTGAVPSEVSMLRTRGFHAPAWLGAMFSGTNDSPFVVMDRANGISVWAANATQTGARTIRVSAAGCFHHHSNGLDKRNPRSTSSRSFRSRGAIPDAMVIRRDLMNAAIANGTGLGHVLHCFFVETSGPAGFCHPMVGCEERQQGWGAEGTRIAIHPGVNLARRGLSHAGLAVARTLQHNGCYLGDNSGTGTCLKAEQTSTRRNPWAGMRFTQHALAGITWNDFVVLPRGWQ
jgi:hypothetical protein